MTVPASGQLWSTTFQIGKETTPGTSVPATRIVYFNPDGTLSRTRAPRPHMFAVGRRDNTLAYTNGPIQAAGSVGLPLSAEEALELFLISVQGGVTPTTPTGATAGRQWVFKPTSTLDSATLEWDDGARGWKGLGVRGDQLTIAGAVADTNMITASLFATDVQQGSLTGSLTQRVPTFLEGWQTRLYMDAFGNAPGNSQIPGLLRNWSVQLQNNLGRVYTADNTLATNRIVTGQLDVTAKLTFDANPSQALTEFNNWDAATKRTIRLEFVGPSAEIEAGVNEVQTLTITGTPTGGTLTLTAMGQTTATIAFNAASGAVQTAINNALASLGSTYTVAVSGGPWPGSAMVVTFSGTGVAARNVGPITANLASLTGGTPAFAAVETTPGYSGGRSVLVDIPGAWTAVNLGANADGIRTYELDLQSVYEPTTLAAMLAVTCQNSRATAY
jgi:hypothetical protein